MKTTVTLYIFLTLFTVNAVAQDFTHTVFGFGLEDEPVSIGKVNSVAFSPDGKTLASGGKYIRLWDVETATHKAAFDHGGSVNSVAFSPDGKTLASGGKYIRLWDVKTATHKAAFDHGGSVNSVAFSPDGKTLASGGKYIRLWDVETATHKATFDYWGSVNSVAFSPDGKILASGGLNSQIHLWDVETATHKATFDHGSWVNSVAFSPDGKTLASGSEGARIHLWDIEAATRKATFNHGSSVNSVAFSPDGKTLVSGGDGARAGGGLVYRIYLWNVETATYKATLDIDSSSWVNSVVFSPDGKTLAIGSEGARIHLWDVDASRIKIILPVRNTFPIHTVVFSPDGKTFASAGEDARIHLWDVDAGTHKVTLGIHERPFPPYKDWYPVHSVAFSPDGKTLASAGADTRGGSIYLWDVDAATHKATFVHGGTVFDPWSIVHSVAFSPDGKTLASAGADARIHLWDVDAATRKATLEIHEGPVHSVAFSPDGKTLASGGADARIYLWDVDAATHKATFGHRSSVHSVAFSPDGKTLASAGGGIQLWDIDTATHKATLSAHSGLARSIAFSPDGKTLASGGEDARTHLWDVDAATHKATLNGHEDPVNSAALSSKTFAQGPGGSVHSVAFSPDGKTLVSAGDDPRIRLWKLPTAHVNVTPYSVVLPAIGEQFTINLSIVEGENVGGYQLTVGFDETILRYVESANGDYLSPGSFFVPPVVSKDAVTLSATSLTGTSNGDGTLATVTFEVLEVKESAIALSDLILADSAGKPFSVLTYSGRIEPTLSSSTTVVDLTPFPVASPSIGERLAFNIRISDGQNVAGYQVSLQYNIKALKPVLASNGLYLPDASPAKPLISEGVVTLGASSTTGVGDGDGILATITFEVLTVQASTVSVSGYLTTPNGLRSTPTFKGAEVIVALLGDVNRDGTVNILDLVLVASSFGQQVPETGNPADVNEDGIVNVIDLVTVAGAIGSGAAAPSLHPQALAALTTADVQQWLTQAQHVDMNDAMAQRGIRFLEQLLAALIPKETALLSNYPNPFNPETWIPYQLAEPAEVTLTIYAVDGTVVRTLVLGYQPVGIYQDKSRAVYWDGKNEVGESLASGVYFYTLTAGEFTATRKMLIRK